MAEGHPRGKPVHGRAARRSEAGRKASIYFLFSASCKLFGWCHSDPGWAFPLTTPRIILTNQQNNPLITPLLQTHTSLNHIHIPLKAPLRVREDWVNILILHRPSYKKTILCRYNVIVFSNQQGRYLSLHIHEILENSKKSSKMK